MAMLFAGLLGVFVAERSAAGGTTAAWLPEGVVIPEITANLMFTTMFAICVVAQWAVWSMKHSDRGNTALALGVLVVFALGMIVMQVNVWERMELPVSQGTYAVVFYGVTVAFMVTLVVGMLFAAVMAFRSLGGRYSARDTEGLSSLAMFWYVLTAVFVSLWYIVYVLK
jgi:heme/copper-type cytochrome/quinol oxidase subunit 3